MTDTAAVVSGLVIGILCCFLGLCFIVFLLIAIAVLGFVVVLGFFQEPEEEEESGGETELEATNVEEEKNSDSTSTQSTKKETSTKEEVSGENESSEEEDNGEEENREGKGIVGKLKKAFGSPDEISAFPAPVGMKIPPAEDEEEETQEEKRPTSERSVSMYTQPGISVDLTQRKSGLNRFRRGHQRPHSMAFTGALARRARGGRFSRSRGRRGRSRFSAHDQASLASKEKLQMMPSFDIFKMSNEELNTVLGMNPKQDGKTPSPNEESDKSAKSSEGEVKPKSDDTKPVKKKSGKKPNKKSRFGGADRRRRIQQQKARPVTMWIQGSQEPRSELFGKLNNMFTDEEKRKKSSKKKKRLSWTPQAIVLGNSLREKPKDKTRGAGGEKVTLDLIKETDFKKIEKIFSGSNSTSWKVDYKGEIVCFKHFSFELSPNSGDSNNAQKKKKKKMFGKKKNKGGGEMIPDISTFVHPFLVRPFGIVHLGSEKRLGVVLEWMSFGDIQNYILKRRKDMGLAEDEDDGFSGFGSGGEQEQEEEKEEKEHMALLFGQKVRILRDIALAIEFLHAQDFVIGDLQTDRIFLGTKVAEAKLSILSMASVFRRVRFKKKLGYFERELSDRRDSEARDNFYYRPGEGGHYKAPEIVLAKSSTKKSDAFSFSMMMWELLFEDFQPFKGKNNIEVHMAIDPTLRPKIDLKRIAGKKESEVIWYIELMKKCWVPSGEERLEFTEIRKILDEQAKKHAFQGAVNST